MIQTKSRMTGVTGQDRTVVGLDSDHVITPKRRRRNQELLIAMTRTLGLGQSTYNNGDPLAVCDENDVNRGRTCCAQCEGSSSLQGIAA